MGTTPSADAAIARVVPPGPRTVPNAVLGMLIFLGTEAMLFAGLISAFLVLRAGMETWPPPDQPRFPLGLTRINTTILLTSGWTMIRARGLLLGGRRLEVSGWLGLTAALGSAFLLVQGIEWVRLVRHGLTMVGGVYGGLFAALIGVHGLHVLGGVAALSRAWRMGRGTGIGDDTLTAVLLYWLFVVGVWPVLFWLVYSS
jgi:heme/copper-type cytochrome/quinol oxidase subunit 3